ncbi:RCC1 domain-containing protein [Amnibacterium flavum]|uniref:Uncharacterized protein n=1 Tax=Amnibacterium flavum TaxID=2173173 RepID=A0A2V1HRQ8_9MICO|nr:hypothetical protein [Amnibacterium flavum]PVZ95275.1 hypothetical protein DDQ50_01750 [Amnibacterium flavum]
MARSVRFRGRALAVGLLALVLGIGGVSVSMTGAWFTATRSASATVTGALLSLGNIGDRDQASIAVSDVYPMTDGQASSAARSEWVTVRNTGTIPLDWTLSVVNPKAVAPLTAAQLAMFRFQLFSEQGQPVTSILRLGDMPAAALPGSFQTQGSALAAGGQSKVELRMWLDTAADDRFQGAQASFDVVINALQNGAGGITSPTMTLTAEKSGSPSGVSTSLKWSDISAALRSNGVADSPVYTVERSQRGDFTDATTVYTGDLLAASDTDGGVPSSVVGISSRDSAECAVTNKGEVYCWGYALVPRLGDGTFVYNGRQAQPTPVLATGELTGKRAVSVVTGGATTCAITSDQRPYCWGRYPGAGSSEAGKPVAVNMSALGSDRVKQISVSVANGANCLLTVNGKVACWGYGVYGTNGSTDTIMTPRTIDNGALQGKTVVSIAGSGQGYCALSSDDSIACWGLEVQGSLGIGSTPFPNRTGVNSGYGSWAPIAVDSGSIAAGTRFTGLSGGDGTVCAKTDTGDFYCWGLMGGGIDSAGRPVAKDRPTLLATPGLSKPDSVFMRGPATTDFQYGSMCALKSGSVYCWGSNVAGWLGLGLSTASPVPIVSTPTRVTGGIVGTGQVAQLDAYGFSPCALMTDGRVSCWGSNFRGSMGNGSVPVSNDGSDYNVSSPAPAAISTGFSAACATGAQSVNGKCTLVTDGSYTYRVRAVISRIGWTSPWAVAARS